MSWDTQPGRYWHTFNAINTKLWDSESGMFYDFDETTGALVKEPVGGNLVAAYAGIGLVDDVTMPGGAGSPQALGVVAQLQSGSYCGPGSSCTPLPSYAVTATNFSTHNYWRGCVHAVQATSHPYSAWCSSFASTSQARVDQCELAHVQRPGVNGRCSRYAVVALKYSTSEQLAPTCGVVLWHADVSKRLQDAILTIVGTQGFWEYVTAVA